eukprot:13313_1
MTTFADDQFTEFAIPTIGVDFRFKTLTIDDRIVKFQIWDIAGLEKFKTSTITKSYYRNATVVMIVYDVADKLSFDNVDGYLHEIETYAPQNVTKMLVGNKEDKNDGREVGSWVAKQFADDNDLYFIEVSAKTGININLTFTFVGAMNEKLKNQLQLSQKIRNVLEENKFHMQQEEFITFNSECTRMRYTENSLVDDVVDVYIGECNKTQIKKLLKIKLKYSSKKRQRFYYILLTKLTKLKLFDRDNFIKILKLIAFNVDPNVDVDAIEQIIRQKQLDGNVFVKEATQYRASSKFAKLFAT